MAHGFFLRSRGPSNRLFAHPGKLMTTKELSRIFAFSTSLRGGLTFDFCNSDTDSLKDRLSFSFSGGKFVSCQSGERCNCIP